MKMDVKAVESAMSNVSNASAVKAAMGNGSIASTMLEEGKPVTMLVKAVKSAMGTDGSKASAVEAATGNGSIASAMLEEQVRHDAWEGSEIRI